MEVVGPGWQSDGVDIRALADLAAPIVGHNRGPKHVPGVVIAGVVVGILLMYAAIRTMFGKKK